MNRFLTLLLALFLFAGSLSAQNQDTDDQVRLQYPNRPVTEILQIYERLTGKNLILDANLQGANLTIQAPNPVSKEKAIHLIEAALLLNGFVLVQSTEDSIKVVNTASGKNPRSEGVALYANAEDLPQGEVIASYFMPLQYLSPDEALPIFQQHVVLHPGYGSLVPVPNAQALLITENASLIQKIAQLRELIDVPPANKTSQFVQLQRANADRVVEMLESLRTERQNANQQRTAQALNVARQQARANRRNNRDNRRQAFANALTNATTPTTSDSLADAQFLADTRTNRVLVITRPINFPYIKSLIEEFDRAVKLTEPFERPLQYISAAEVLPVLTDILTEDETQNSGAASGGNRRTSTTTQTRQQSSSSIGGSDQLSAPSDDVAPSSVIVGSTRIIADPRANSILVMGPPESIDKVREILDRLDKRPLQVYLSTVIGQLTLRNDTELAVDILQKYGKQGDFGMGSSTRTRSGGGDIIIDPSTLTNPSTFPVLSGLTVYGALGSVIDTYVKALSSSSRFKILSRPSVYTANNKKAVILSGRKVAVPTTTVSDLSPSSSASTAISSNIEYQDVVLKLEVIPLINSNQEVTLQIAQQNDNIIDTELISGNEVPIISTQEIETTVTVPNRTTVVLGGLIIEGDEKIETGIPLLKDIPLVGNLFKGTQKNLDRNELIVLIQPTVIQTEEDLLRASEEEALRSQMQKSVIEFSDNTGETLLKIDEKDQ